MPEISGFQVLWAQKIEINRRVLFLTIWLRSQAIIIPNITRLDISEQGKKYLLTVHQSHHDCSPIEMDVSSFNRHEIKNLLHKLKTQNPNIQVVMPQDF